MGSNRERDLLENKEHEMRARGRGCSEVSSAHSRLFVLRLEGK